VLTNSSTSEHWARINAIQIFPLNFQALKTQICSSNKGEPSVQGERGKEEIDIPRP